MRNRIRHLLVPALALTIGLSAQIPAAQIAAQQAPEYGPPNGTLLIAGGGVRDEAIYERFIELGGGAENGRFIIVPTAGGNFDGDGDPREYGENRVLRGWMARGLQNVSMLHTHDPTVADTEAFVAELKQATGVATMPSPARAANWQADSGVSPAWPNNPVIVAPIARWMTPLFSEIGSLTAAT